MRHIHISLVGGQTEPIYSMIKILTPDEVILICSEKTYEETLDITGLLNRQNTSVHIKSFDPSNLKTISEDIESIKNTLNDDDILTINLVGGTKFWSLSFYKMFSDRPNTHFFLLDQNKTFWNLTNNLSFTTEALDIDTILSLYGNELASYRSIEDYNEADDESLKHIQRIRNSRKHFTTFKNLATILSPEMLEQLIYNDEGTFKDKQGNFISWEKPDIIDINFGRMTCHLESPNAVNLTFNCGWFEYKVARLIKGWEKATDIRLNCIFSSSQGFTKNEIDIIVNTDKKPIFIECKTKLYNSTDIDKFSTVVKNYGGASCKALFVTERPMNDLQMTKCKDSGIYYFCLENHTEDNLHADLYSFLDRLLLEINK